MATQAAVHQLHRVAGTERGGSEGTCRDRVDVSAVQAGSRYVGREAGYAVGYGYWKSKRSDELQA